MGYPYPHIAPTEKRRPRGAQEAPYPRQNPLAELLYSPELGNLTRRRRDVGQLLTLLEASAVLHYKTRKLDPEGFLVATVDDYAMVHPLVESIFPMEGDGLSPNEVVAYKAVRDLVTGGEETITAAALKGKLKVSLNTAKNRLAALEKAELLELCDPVAKGKKALWTLTDRRAGFLSALPDPKTVAERFRQARAGNLDTFVDTLADTQEQPRFVESLQADMEPPSGPQLKPGDTRLTPSGKGEFPTNSGSSESQATQPVNNSAGEGVAPALLACSREEISAPLSNSSSEGAPDSGPDWGVVADHWKARHQETAQP